MGEGGADFQPIPATGGELPIVLGAQGGIHVLVAFRVVDVDLNVLATYRLVDPDTGEEIATLVRDLGPSGFGRDAAGVVRNPDLLVLDPSSASVEAFAGRRLRLELEVISEASHACDARVVTLRSP